MKLDAPVNANYAATVTRLPKLLELTGSDFLVGASLYGFQAVISKDHAQGELGIVFGAECQLSEEFTKANNLYRHAEFNADQEAKGYLEDNRRVRAIKLRGHRSDCLWLPLESLAFTGVKLDELTEGMTFDRLGDHELCRKYVVKTKGPRNTPPQEKKFVRVDPKLFPPHVDTENYWRNAHLIGPNETVTVTAKLHGSSWRGTRTNVLRKLSLRDRIAKRLGVKVDGLEPIHPLVGDVYRGLAIKLRLLREWMSAVEWIEAERASLFADLGDASRRGINTDWSIATASIAERIKQADELLGDRLRWQQISSTNFYLYERVYGEPIPKEALLWAKEQGYSVAPLEMPDEDAA